MIGPAKTGCGRWEAADQINARLNAGSTPATVLGYFDPSKHRRENKADKQAVPFDRMAAMNEAGDMAHEALAKIREKATPEQNEGIDLLINWFKLNYRTAGYKRLCRPLVRG